MKATAIASTDIALVKYWGRKNNELRIPSNTNIAMLLDDMLTTTTVEFSEEYEEDYFNFEGTDLEPGRAYDRVVRHVQRIRDVAGIELNAKVHSKNSFPAGTGLSSSSSGFGALTVATAKAAGLDLSIPELSRLSRMASGSACRTVVNGGFAIWHAGDSDETSYSEQLFPQDHWNLVDVIALVSKGPKKISSSRGHKLAPTSPFFEARNAYMPQRVDDCIQYIKDRNFSKLGELIEHEAIDLHCIMMSSYPNLLYMTKESFNLIKLVQQWREEEGIEAYFTLNTGQDVHIICEEGTKDKVVEKLKEIEDVRDVRVNHVGEGARLSEEHLF